MKDLTQHRSVAYSWTYLKTTIFGGHEWNFFKIMDSDRDRDLEADCNLYLVDYKKYKKQIKDLCKTLDDFTWFPTDKYYVKAINGNDRGLIKDTEIDLTTKAGKEKMLKLAELKEKDFLRWILIVMDYEDIKTAKDIVDKFHFLIERFKIFSRIDMNPKEMADYFNEKLSKIDDHNIEPINKIYFKEFYDFAMNPEVYPLTIKKAIDRLFYHVNESDWLKGLASGENMKWSFKTYTYYLSKIFRCKYNKKILENIDSYRRLNENEFLVYNVNQMYINSELYIPDDVRQTYDLHIAPEDIKEKETLKEESIKEVQEEIAEFIDNRKDKYKFTLDKVAKKWAALKNKPTKAEAKLKKMKDAKDKLDQIL